jgi:hypothetical protein
MSLADPITVAANGTTSMPELSFSVIRKDGYGSERIDANGEPITLVINHDQNKNGSRRHYVKLTKVVDAVNPYSGATQRQTLSVSFSVARPSFGFDDADVVQLAQALFDTIADSEVTLTNLVTLQS